MMRSARILLVTTTGVLLSALPLLADEAVPRITIAPGHGQFVFRDPAGNPQRPIPVHTYRPRSFGQASPILFAMHGMSRKAVGALQCWTEYADRHGVLVLAPEFSNAHYPGGAMYNRGNLTGLWGAVPPAKWTYTAIERLFDAVRLATGSQRSRYLIFGHSAGGQFVHRLVLFVPNARIETAFAANAGWYAMPTFAVEYPYGLKDSVATKESLARAFSQPLVLLLGDQDVKPNALDLNTSSGANAQGPHRFARGHTFFKAATEEAGHMGVPLRWRLQTVPGVGHSSSETSHAAQKLLETHTRR